MDITLCRAEYLLPLAAPDRGVRIRDGYVLSDGESLVEVGPWSPQVEQRLRTTYGDRLEVVGRASGGVEPTGNRQQQQRQGEKPEGERLTDPLGGRTGKRQSQNGNDEGGPGGHGGPRGEVARVHRSRIPKIGGRVKPSGLGCLACRSYPRFKRSRRGSMSIW